MNPQMQCQLELAEVHLKHAARMAMSEDAASLEHHRRYATKIKSDVNHKRCEVQIAIAIADGTEIDMTPVTITITPDILYELAGDVMDETPAQWLERYGHRLTMMLLEHSRNEVKYIECHRPGLMLVDSDGQRRPML